MSGLKVSIDQRVARIVFDRPDALNALSPSTLSELIDVCAGLEQDDAVRAHVGAQNEIVLHVTPPPRGAS